MYICKQVRVWYDSPEPVAALGQIAQSCSANHWQIEIKPPTPLSARRPLLILLGCILAKEN